MKHYVFIVIYDNGEWYEDNINHIHTVCATKAAATKIVDGFNATAKSEKDYMTGFERKAYLSWEKWEVGGGKTKCVESYNPVND